MVAYVQDRVDKMLKVCIMCSGCYIIAQLLHVARQNE